MVTVKPGDVVTQRHDDVVVYQLRLEDWNKDIDRPDNKTARISIRTIQGAPTISAKLQDYRPGAQVQELRITGGATMRGQYEVIRTVKSPTETRSRNFTVRTT